MKPRKYTLADAQLAAARLFLLPSVECRLDEEDLDFLETDIVGELLDGKWPEVMPWPSKETQKQ